MDSKYIKELNLFINELDEFISSVNIIIDNFKVGDVVHDKEKIKKYKEDIKMMNEKKDNFFVVDRLESIKSFLKYLSDKYNYMLDDDSNFITASTTHVNNINDIFKKINKKINKNYTNKMDIFLEKYIHEKKNLAIHEILNSKNIIDGVDIYTEKLKNNIKAVEFYIKIIEGVISQLMKKPKENKTTIRDIYKKIEYIKNYSLESKSIRNMKITKEKIYNNPPTQLFGLVAGSDFLPIDQLLSPILKTKITSDNFDKLSTDNNIIIILLTNQVPKPIEFNLSNLFEKKYKTHSKKEGISLKTVLQHQTIKMSDIKKKLDWKFSGKIFNLNKKFDFSRKFPAGHPQKCLIIESNGSGNYRLLLIWENSNPIQNIKNVEHVVRYVRDNNYSSNIKSRAYLYHNIKSKSIMKNIYASKPFPLTEINKEIRSVEYKYLRHSIKAKLMSLFDKDIKKNIDEYLFEKYIHSFEFTDILISTIIEGYKKYSQDLNIKYTPRFSEIVITFMKDISYISRKFTRELHDTYSSTDIKTENLFDTRNTFEKIINDTLEKTINENTNVYQTMLRKHKILNM